MITIGKMKIIRLAIYLFLTLLKVTSIKTPQTRSMATQLLSQLPR
jgi:hypothetical protein